MAQEWSDTEKAEVLVAYMEVGTAQASRDSGIPARTIRYWAKQAGLTAAKREQMEAAAEGLSVDIAERRTTVKELLLLAAETFAERSLDSKPREAQSLMTAAAIAIDKFRLEMGEATSRVESRELNAAERAKAKVDELAQRRSQKAG